MKHRCYFISVMCGMSLYSWYNYSLFDPINNSFFTPYYQNCLLLLFYLGWDTYHMITKPILFRTDLMIHHSITAFGGVSYINNISLQLSNVTIMECISLMNYIWRNNPQVLKLYRTICIFCISIPLSLWMWFYYNPTIAKPYWIITIPHTHYYFLNLIITNVYFFILSYDVFIFQLAAMW